MITFIQPQHKQTIVAARHDPDIDYCEIVQLPVLAIICDSEDRHAYDYLIQSGVAPIHFNDYHDDPNIICYDVVLDSELPTVLYYYQTRDCDGCSYHTYTEMTAHKEAEEKYMREHNPSAL